MAPARFAQALIGAIVAVLIPLAVVVIIVHTAGCAAVPAPAAPAPRPASAPACERWGAEQVRDEDGALLGIFIDVDNLRRLYTLIRGLASGACRLPS
jgi:hypothetical protein